MHLVDQYGYGGLFVAMALANVGAPVGSELILPAAGALAATGHLSSAWLVVAVAVGAELFGQSVSYAVGRFGGRPFVERYGKYVRFHHAQLEQVEGFFARWGSPAIFVCRFIPVIRGIVGIPAGIAEMPLAAFYVWTLLGSLVFCGGFVLLGGVLGEHAGEISAAIRKYALLIVGLGILAGAAFLIVRNRRVKPTVP